MQSVRFGRAVVLTHHARMRMVERGVTFVLLSEIIEVGTAKWKDASRLWLYLPSADHDGATACVVAVIENVLVVKTVMVDFDPEARL